MRWKGKKIGVIMGGSSQEREVSLSTGEAVSEALKRRGHNVTPIIADRRLWEKLRETHVELAFIALHGPMGEDGAVQGLLEWMGIPYVGSRVLGSALGMNKVVSKELLLFHGIPTPDFKAFFRKDYPQGLESGALNWKGPCVVKPASQGSTLGLTVVREEAQLEGAIKQAFEIDEEILVEDFVEGRLLAAGIVGDRDLPLVEIRPKSGIYDYESKYTEGKTDYIVPAPLNPGIRKGCAETALRTHKVLRCRGLSRVDLILDSKGNPMVLECNTIPGMTGTSLLPMAAREAGMEFGELLEAILETV